jgi:alkanesulfonate monooxygenase SsuD/methylene tetrahydromethanopterin reductase-like flavin-dependent oxidoreductase (luciferase family)
MNRKKITFGITPIQAGVDFDHIRKITVRAEELGYDSVWLNDHLFTSDIFYPLPPPTAPYYECWTTISALAALTKEVRLGTLCTNICFRNPALLAKMAACVDQISEGRLELALGAGWFEREHLAYGFPFPSIKERAERLVETVKILRSLWSKEKTTFTGNYLSLVDAYCSPKPWEGRRIPLTVGARGSKIMLKLVARNADGWNIQTPLLPEQYQRKLQFLENYCREAGREPETINRSLWAGTIIAENERSFSKAVAELPRVSPSYFSSRIAGTPDECIQKINAFVQLGVTGFIFYFTWDEMASLELFAERVLPAFK